jgi:hypothetical protein
VTTARAAGVHSLAGVLALLVAGLWLLPSRTTPLACRHAGDRIVCADARTFPIVAGEARPTAADGLPPFWGRDTGRRRDRPHADLDGVIVTGPDGVVCRLHGEHFHCRR